MRSEELIDASDAELVVAALASNTQAFDVLVNRYRRAMLTVAQKNCPKRRRCRRCRTGRTFTGF